MEIYFVRHGETSGNVAKRHQSEKTPLTTKGQKQALDAGIFLETLPPTHLVSSPMIRALETAKIIGIHTNLIPEISAVFAEVGRPARMNGFHLKSIYSLWFYTRWYFGLTNFEKDGGETYHMVRARLQAAKEYLGTYPPDAKIIVVSHSVFIVFFLAHLCQEGRMNPFQALFRFLGIIKIKNGSITKVIYDPTSPQHTCQWRTQKIT
jgi:broad specificity phosphatase PhoE